MDPVIAGLLGVVVGGVSGILGSLVAGLMKLHSERDNWRREQESARKQDRRVAQAEFTRQACYAMQRMGWLAWKGHQVPHQVKEEDFSEYDKAMYELLPQVFAALTAVGIEDEQTHARMQKLVLAISDLDMKIGRAGALYRDGDHAWEHALASCRGPSGTLYLELLNLADADNLSQNRERHTVD